MSARGDLLIRRSRRSHDLDHGDEEPGGFLIKRLQHVFPEQKPSNRTLINAWQDVRVVDNTV
jgi:hypothetical protein